MMQTRACNLNHKHIDTTSGQQLPARMGDVGFEVSLWFVLTSVSLCQRFNYH